MIHHLIFQEVGKYNFKINVISKTVEKYISFTIKPVLPLEFIKSVQFLNNSLDNLVKNVEKNDFYHLRQHFNANTLDLVKKKVFFPMTIGIA